jgi:hypothetical protein
MGRLAEAIADTWGYPLSAEALLLVVSTRPAPARPLASYSTPWPILLR